MDYELCKKLKDAGFRQKDGCGRWFCVGNWYKETISGLKNGDIIKLEPKDTSVYCPTLSELIEACGDVFYSLTQKPITRYWLAKAFIDYEILKETKGSTPEEAVANLWLELNNK